MKYRNDLAGSFYSIGWEDSRLRLDYRFPFDYMYLLGYYNYKGYMLEATVVELQKKQGENLVKYINIIKK